MRSQPGFGPPTEICWAQVAACVGKEGDATPFTEVTVDNISTALLKCGYQSRGWEVSGTQPQMLKFGRNST